MGPLQRAGGWLGGLVVGDVEALSGYRSCSSSGSPGDAEAVEAPIPMLETRVRESLWS